MAQLYAYLTFNGNCREAMTFYHTCFGGNLNLQTVGESPKAEKLPDAMQKAILHATLKNDSLTLLGSDMVGEDGLQQGNTVSLLLECDSKEQFYGTYNRLVKNGSSHHSVETTFGGALLADLTDQFGKKWLLHFANQHP